MTPQFFATQAAFRRWLEAHHAKERELLVGFYKRGSGKPSITWPESVDEALCFGWIDGVRKSLSEEAYTIRFTPRKTTSIWSAINVARVAALQALGKLTPAGERAFAARTERRTGVYSHERSEAAALDPEQQKRLAASPAAAAFFAGQAPWYRRAATHWVVSAKRPETRERRFAELLACSAEGRSIGLLKRPARAPRAQKTAMGKGAAKASPVRERATKRSPARER